MGGKNSFPEAAQPRLATMLAASARPRSARRRLKGVFAEIRVYKKLTTKIQQNRAVVKGRAKKK